MIRAVTSVLSQTDCSVVPIIVVNGSRYDSDALEYWRARRDVRLFELDEGDVVKARLFGRRSVDTEFFGFLDDDDVYLPSAVSARLGPMQSDQSVDVVVGNGLIERSGEESVVLTQIALHRARPLVGLAIENWMPSACAALFRSATVGAQYFEEPDRYMEWTALAFRMVTDGLNVVFLNDLTYRIADTPGSLSKTLAYAREAPNTLRRMLDTPLPADAKRIWERKYSAALHGLSDHYRLHGELGPAWKAHIRSLLRPGGINYALYTRHLLCRTRAP